MKTFFTLLLAAGAFNASSAQASYEKDKKGKQDVINNEYKKIDTHRDNIYTFTAQDRDVYIAKINKDFNLKVRSTKTNKRLSSREKREMIQKAKVERAQQIKIVNAKFNSKYNSAYNNHGEKSNDRRR